MHDPRLRGVLMDSGHRVNYLRNNPSRGKRLVVWRAAGSRSPHLLSPSSSTNKNDETCVAFLGNLLLESSFESSTPLPISLYWTKICLHAQMSFADFLFGQLRIWMWQLEGFHIRRHQCASSSCAVQLSNPGPVKL